MNAVGIIAEFNPLHLGHKYLLDTVRDKYDCVLCVLSGNFVQRGDVAVISKQARAEMALNSGADLCIELPVAWSMTTAQNFAFGGISLLKNLGCVNAVAFGSECGDIELLKKTAIAASQDEFKRCLDVELSMGRTFAAARQTAISVLMGSDADILSKPNNTLAAEYISAAQRLNFSPELFTIKRLGAEHGANVADDGTASAGYIRTSLLNGDLDTASDFMSDEAFEILKREYSEGRIADINNIEMAILANLRLKRSNDFLNLPDLSEGLENKLYSAIKTTSSLADLYAFIKTKRYTMARIRRIVLSAFLQIDKRFFGMQPPYIRVLGFNEQGEKLLKKAAKTSIVPIVSRVKDFSGLDEFSKEVFACECHATDIFALSTAVPLPCGLEYTEKIIKV